MDMNKIDSKYLIPDQKVKYPVKMLSDFCENFWIPENWDLIKYNDHSFVAFSKKKVIVKFLVIDWDSRLGFQEK